MDPEKVIYELIDSISRNDREQIEEKLQSLLEWNRKGGFMPMIAAKPTELGVTYLIVPVSKK